MNCETCRKTLLQSPSDEIPVRDHLSECPDCRDFAEHVARTRDLLKNDPAGDPPADGWERLRERLRAAPSETTASLWWMGAAAAVFAAVGLWQVSGSPIADPAPPNHLPVEVVAEAPETRRVEARELLDLHAAMATLAPHSETGLIRVLHEEEVR